MKTSGYRLCVKSSSAWLILNAALLLFTFSEHVFGQKFVNQTQSAGLITVIGTNGAAAADYDLDGDIDIYFVGEAPYKPSDKRTWNRLFSNNNDGTFSEVSSSIDFAGYDTSSITSYWGKKMGAAWGDYDNDGYPDLFITNLGPDHLFHNNGGGSFTDVSETAGIQGGSTQGSTSGLWFDYDVDGDLDLYISIWADYTSSNPDSRNRMYENTGNGSFINVSEPSGLNDSGKTWTSVALDVNNDGLPDLYLANDFGENRLYINNGNKTFTEKTEEYNLSDPYEGMGLAVADCDGNGFFDIYLTNVTEMGFDEQLNRLFLNTGEGSFIKASDVGASHAGWGWGTEFSDIDNDGDEDLYVVNGYFSHVFANRLFINQSDQDSVRFVESGADYGLDDTREARGLVIFDYNDDGNQDILVSNFERNTSFYQNPGTGKNWLKIKLEGTESNRSAFGTSVEAVINGRSYKKYHHGAQFLGQNILPVHFGTGETEVVDKIIIRWTNGHVDSLENIPVNQTIHIIENSGLINSVTDDYSPLPDEILLEGNYPNPFNNSTGISFTIKSGAEVEVIIYNSLGQVVNILNESYSSGGKKVIQFIAQDKNFNELSSGLYFYRISSNGYAGKTGKMLFIK